MFDYFGLSEKATQIYFSNLRFKLKNDSVCRIICQEIKDSSSASILLYDGKQDKLVNFGHYLDHSLIDLNNNKESLIGDLIKDITHFEYFAHRYQTNTLEKCDFENFKSLNFFFSKSPEVIKSLNNEGRFDELKKIFFDNTNENTTKLYNIYKLYKGTIANKDVYDLRNQTSPSAKYFFDLYNSKVSTSKLEYRLFQSSEIKETDKTLTRIYEDSLNIPLKRNSWYLAVPLYAKKRHIGLLRILIRMNRTDSNLESYNFQEWFSKYIKDNIIRLSFIVSRLIANTFGNNEFKQFSYESVRLNMTDLREDEHNITQHSQVQIQPKNYFSVFCESIRRTISCRGCIIRFEAESPVGFIKGWTKDLDEYVPKVFLNDHFKKNIENLNILLSPKSDRKKDNRVINICAVKFIFSGVRVEKIEYYYFTTDEILNTLSAQELANIDRKIVNVISEIFVSSIINKLQEYNISEVIILKVPYNTGAFITLVNTNFRPFIIEDVNIVYPHITRFGSELFIRNNTFQDSLSQVLSEVKHSIDAPIDIAIDTINTINITVKELASNDFPEAEITKYKIALKNLNESGEEIPLFRIADLLRYIKQRLVVASLATNLKLNTINTEETEPYSLEAVLSHYIKLFRPIALHGNRLNIEKTWRYHSSENKISITHNNAILTAIIFLLLENAEKYSFGLDKRKLMVDNYSQIFADNSDGHIKVGCFSSDQEYGFSITNWGKRIFEDEKKLIFGESFRGKYDPEFDKQDSLLKGTGMGLYFIKRYVELLKGIIILETSGHKTCFKIIWKKN
jgi:signal transduction histidine kinase